MPSSWASVGLGEVACVGELGPRQADPSGPGTEVLRSHPRAGDRLLGGGVRIRQALVDLVADDLERQVLVALER